ncbi:MAG: hypothetical protein HC774_00505 [Sphingomonadales bacterium]|nr:hypothetical protein [Sphingomonadales bacterium]
MRTAQERMAYLQEKMRPVGRTERMWVHDDWREFEIVSVPVDGLVINADNRRFRAERMWAEAQLGRSLDPENMNDDELTVISLLLDKSHRLENGRLVGSPSEDSLALHRDWERRRQQSPFWIRPDGLVRNGNRRLAMIKRAQRAAGDTGLRFVDAVILPVEDIDESALLELEQREQLTENFKVRYDDIDYLLALQEAAQSRDIDWFSDTSMDEVAGQLQSMVEKSKAEVIRDLYAIKYMDLFLEDSGQPGEYHRLLRNLERFRDIARTMIRVEAEYPLDVDKVVQVLFAAVRAGTTHLDIREIRRMLIQDRERFDALADQIAAAEESWTASESVLESPDLSEPVSDDSEDDDPGPDVRNYPREDVTAAIQIGIDSFKASREVDVSRTLAEVKVRLELVNDAGVLTAALAGTQGAQVETSMRAVVDWADRHRGLLP